MNPTEQIKALAELDGFVANADEEFVLDNPFSPTGVAIHRKVFRNCRCFVDKHYLTRYDAIIPLIQKQPAGVMIDFTYHLWRIIERDAKRNYNRQYDAWRLVIATPAQLCEALLRATGKWKDQ